MFTPPRRALAAGTSVKFQYYGNPILVPSANDLRDFADFRLRAPTFGEPLAKSKSHVSAAAFEFNINSEKDENITTVKPLITG